MTTHNVKLSKEGRVLIPADVRSALGLNEGDLLSLKVEAGEIRLFDRTQALQRAQQIAQRFKKPGESVVDEFLNERRRAAARE